MKVVHVTNYFRGTHQHVGGAEQACFRTAKMLVDHGHASVLVTKVFDNPRGAGESGLPVRPVKVLEDYLPKFVGKYLEVLKWYVFQYDPVSSRAFGRILRDEKPDAVHFHNFQFLTFSLIRKAARLGYRTCLSIYDYWLFCPKSMLLLPDNRRCHEAHGTGCIRCLPPQFTWVQKILLSMRRRVFDRCFERIDRFIVLSEHSAGVLKSYGIADEKIRLVPLTLPLEYAGPGEGGGRKVTVPPKSILFVGWLNDRKGIHIAIEAMVDILRQEPDAVLYVIGGRAKFSDAYEERFQKTIQDHGMKDRIRFLGHQEPDVVQAYLEAADVLILPEQYENMSPLVMVEAMMLGTPVVASRLGGIPEYIENGVTGFLADPYDPADFARKVVALLRDPDLRARVGSLGCESIQARNSNERVWEQTLATYRTLEFKS